MALSNAMDSFHALARGATRCAERHRLALFLGAIIATSACFSVLPATTLGESLAQSAALAVVALLAVGLGHPRAVDLRRVKRRSTRPTRTAERLDGWAGYVLAMGLAVGVVATIPALTSAAPAFVSVSAFPLPVAAIGQIIVLCLLTGVFEEGVFRVLAIDAFAPLLGGGARGLLWASVASAALFGALHVSAGEAFAVGGAVAGAQVVLKPVQAALFGFFMAALWARTGSLWTLAAVHGAFNLVYAGPSLLLAGMPATYVTGDPADLALLVGTIALLVPPALAAYRRLRA